METGSRFNSKLRIYASGLRILAGIQRNTAMHLCGHQDKKDSTGNHCSCQKGSSGFCCLPLCVPFQWWPRQSIALLDPSSRFDSGDTHLLQQSTKSVSNKGQSPMQKAHRCTSPNRKSMVPATMPCSTTIPQAQHVQQALSHGQVSRECKLDRPKRTL